MFKAAKIPDQVKINGEWWLVIWRSNKDPAWRKYGAWGVTMPAKRKRGKPLQKAWDGRVIAGEIHLCDSLLSKGRQGQLEDTWLHECMHAALRSLKGRGKRTLTFDLEERVVRHLAKVISEIN